MSHEVLITLLILLSTNVFVIGGAYVKIKTSLTEIKTDLKWIKRQCPRCQPTSENDST